MMRKMLAAFLFISLVQLVLEAKAWATFSDTRRDSEPYAANLVVPKKVRDLGIPAEVSASLIKAFRNVPNAMAEDFAAAHVVFPKLTEAQYRQLIAAYETKYPLPYRPDAK